MRGIVTMNVVWKRPDGFHGASPSDFHIVELAGHSRLWLHKTDKDMFPFRVAGGWEEDQATRRLNNLINLINQPSGDWVKHLVKAYGHSTTDSPQVYFDELVSWISTLSQHLKGDKWETEIMEHALSMVAQKITDIKADFLKTAAS